jgi:propionyl-CoA carboxylase alpha chain
LIPSHTKANYSISGVAPGQRVEAGQQVVVIEAMKMQNILRAEKAGVVKSIKKAVGAPLKVDEIVVEFE